MFCSGTNLTSPNFTWWRMTRLHQLKHRKPEVSKNPESPWDGWPSYGLFCEDNDTQKRNVCWSRAHALGSFCPRQLPRCRATNWPPFLLRPDDMMPPHVMGQYQWEALRALTLEKWTMTAMNPNAKPSGRGTKCVSPSGGVPQPPHGGGRDHPLLQLCSVWSKTAQAK